MDLQIAHRIFTSKQPEADERIAALSPDAQAGLRQFSLERMMGYGIDYADAVEFRARVMQSEPWQEAAAAMAEALRSQARALSPITSEVSRSALYYRASALFRMSQALMLQDDARRVEIVEHAVDCFSRASPAGVRRQRVSIETPNGALAGWFVQASGDSTVGAAITIGGIEGWAMDFDCVGAALAQRGVATLLLDAPGQGETRILNRHYLSPAWLDSFRCSIDYLQRELPGQPIGIVGNSMGGSIAMAAANGDRRIIACCDNGGAIQPSQGRAAGATFFAKMVAFCGTQDPDVATAIWDTVEPVRPGINTDYSLLVIQGGLDPLISKEHGQQLLSRAPSKKKRMEIFSDGDHCIYNHLNDRNILMADWMRHQLASANAQP